VAYKRPDLNYWNSKLTAYLHDPIDKAFRIKGHEERGARLIDLLGLQKPNEESWKAADSMAAGFERGRLPSYSTDENKNGAVDFIKSPVLTHPVSESGSIAIDCSFNHSQINADMEKIISESIKFPQTGDETLYARNRFYYVHLLLRYQLAGENAGKIGALWHRLPADTRFPDHTIWHHNSLTSALYSCMESGRGEEDLGLAVFSITPVQQFISSARKLRDYWTGSLLLSWLAFEGIKWVMENQGPDHVLYPSLVDQPLVMEYLKDQPGFESPADKYRLNSSNDIATFPNKILFTVPLSSAEEICSSISEHIKEKWDELGSIVLENIFNKIPGFNDEERKSLKRLFSRQTGNFWSFNWAAAKMIGRGDLNNLEKLMEPEVWKNQDEMYKLFSPSGNGKGIYYSTSHRLVQSALASDKVRKTVTREPENGVKCHICAEYEVLNTLQNPENTVASFYKENIDSFWKRLTDVYGKSDLNEGEKLCSLCMVKRLAYSALKNMIGHPLHASFRGREGYPATTEFALHDFFKRENINDKKTKKDIADRFFDNDSPAGGLTGLKEGKLKPADRYYAILLMDGDKMGALINGDTVAATWGSVLHPDIKAKLQSASFDAGHRDRWSRVFSDPELNKRMLSPAVHAAVSESLGDFALYGVKSVIDKYDGSLIYAGGDDVCAVLPVSGALKAAGEIKDYYNSVFRMIDEQGNPLADEIEGEWKPGKGKLSVNLGKGKDISISGAVLICHHKEALSEMIDRAHTLLDERAKGMCKRNALAVELKKRSGGSRFFEAKWDSGLWSDLLNIGNFINSEDFDSRLSRSLIYRLEQMRTGIEPLIEKDPELYTRFIEKQIIRSLVSGSNEEKIENMAAQVARLTVDDEGRFSHEPLVIAAFIGGGDL
jgi:CRISPR-associated protein Cmr2